MKSKILRTFLLALSVCLFACGNDDDTMSSTNTNKNQTTNAFSAKIDGQMITSDFTNGVLSVSENRYVFSTRINNRLDLLQVSITGDLIKDKSYVATINFVPGNNPTGALLTQSGTVKITTFDKANKKVSFEFSGEISSLLSMEKKKIENGVFKDVVYVLGPEI